MFASNQFALLSDDASPVAAVKKVAPAPEPAKKAQAANQERKQQGPRRDRDQRPAGRGRGGRASAPRQNRDSNNEDFTGGNPAEERSDRPRRNDDRPRRHGDGYRGRQYDRHSGTGRVDGEKKEVAGNSWGNAVDAAGVKEGQSAQEAVAAAEQPAGDADNAAEQTTEFKAPEEEDKTKSFAEYQKELAAKKTLKAKAVRKANEGVDDAAWKSAKVLEKPIVDEADDIALLLQGSKKPAAHKKKERKEKQSVDIEVRFTEDPARRGGDRGGFRGDRGGFRGGRGGGASSRPNSSRPSQKAVNINDQSAFPSLS